MSLQFPRWSPLLLESCKRSVGEKETSVLSLLELTRIRVGFAPILIPGMKQRQLTQYLKRIAIDSSGSGINCILESLLGTAEISILNITVEWL